MKPGRKPRMRPSATKKPAPSTDETRDLIARAQAGDSAALSKLVDTHSGLVHATVRTRTGNRDCPDYYDLAQEGSIGLIKAIERFDLKQVDEVTGKPIKFSTYAVWWVDHAIRRAQPHHGPATVYVPIYQRVLEGQRRRGEVSARTPHDRDAESVLRPGAYVSLHRRLANSYDATVADLIEDRSAPTETALNRAIDCQRVRSVVATVTVDDREAEILRGRLYEDRWTLKQVGDRHGVSRERIRQIEHALRGRIRDALRFELGADAG